MNYVIAYSSDKGNVKSVNQDSLYFVEGAYKSKNFAVLALCDGMGGVQLGERISSTIVYTIQEKIIDIIIRFIEEQNQDVFYFEVQKIVTNLNELAIEYGKQNNIRLGSTLSLLVCINYETYIFNIGDSRVYKIDDLISQISKDDTLIQQEIDRNLISKKDAKNDKRKNILTACIGIENDAVLKINTDVINQDTMYLLCSDGYRNVFEIKEVYSELKKAKTKQELTAVLDKSIIEIKKRKEEDNISVMVVKLYE